MLPGEDLEDARADPFIARAGISESLSAAFGALIIAVGRFAAAADIHYRGERPEEHARLVEVFNAGRGDLVARIQVSLDHTPAPKVTLALVTGAQERVFFETTGVEVTRGRKH